MSANKSSSDGSKDKSKGSGGSPLLFLVMAAALGVGGYFLFKRDDVKKSFKGATDKIQDTFDHHTGKSKAGGKA